MLRLHDELSERRRRTGRAWRLVGMYRVASAGKRTARNSRPLLPWIVITRTASMSAASDATAQ
jgi:hypothetical protein